jgi:hypothetical protein
MEVFDFRDVFEFLWRVRGRVEGEVEGVRRREVGGREEGGGGGGCEGRRGAKVGRRVDVGKCRGGRGAKRRERRGGREEGERRGEGGLRDTCEFQANIFVSHPTVHTTFPICLAW